MKRDSFLASAYKIKYSTVHAICKTKELNKKQASAANKPASLLHR